MTVESRPVRSRARILSRSVIADGYVETRVAWEETSPPGLPEPGQFFTLLPVKYPIPMLRRPFAYSGVTAGGFSFIYEIRGKATSDLAAAGEGVEIDCIGPLGRGFRPTAGGSRPILVAGGIGVGPIFFLAGQLAERREIPLVVLGARSAGLLPRLNWPSGIELRICTDDGSAGIRGNVLSAISDSDMIDADLFVCGPDPMMAAVHRLALTHGRSCQVSMEELMACGVGACQGCVVETVTGDGSSGGYLRVCVEGPVFDSRMIRWPSMT